MERPNILIVEDERIVAADIQEMLEYSGYRVMGVEDTGEKAIQSACSKQPDLILMDIMLKGQVNGIQAAFRINKTEKIPIIYVTANVDNTSFREAIHNNPYGYITKPFRQSDLQASVALALSHRKKTEIKIPETAVKTGQSPFASMLAQYNTSLLKLFTEVKEGQISNVMLNLLIKICFKLAVFKVRKNFSKIATINRRWELSAEDVAVESIANLFVMNDRQGMLNIRTMLIKWDEAAETEMDALFFLNKAVGLSVEQQIKKMLRESDPFLAKEIDTVVYTVKTNGYKKLDYFGINYIVRESIEEITGKTIGIEEFMNIPVDFRMKKHEIIEDMINHLASETAYFPAVPLNALAERLLCCRQSEQDAALIECRSHFGHFSTDNIVECALRKTMQKLKTSYLDKEKIDIAQFGIIHKSLKDIAFDLKGGNTIWNLSDYIRAHKPDLTQSEYSRVYQNLFEYLIKTFKKYIINYI